MTSATTRSDTPARARTHKRRLALAGEGELVGHAFTDVHTAVADEWLAGLLGDEPDVALVAVGSYGRGELCPYSDLDVVLVHRRRRDVGAVADRVWYPIWDAGVRLDHSVRTVGEALDVARVDLKVVLGLLDARVVAGDAELGDELARGALDLWRRDGPRFLPVLEREARARHARMGEVAYLLEPDLKEGRGGQRDVTILRALHEVGIPGAGRPDLERAAHTLLSARVALQLQVERPEERLLLELQDDVAGALGERDADALMASIASSARTVSWVFDNAWSALRVRARRRSPRSLPLGHGLAVSEDEVVLTDDADVLGDDSLVLRAATASAYQGLPIAQRAIDHMVVAAPRMTSTWTADARDAFVALLGAGDAAVEVVEMLDQYGLWSRVLPEWAAVRCLPQRNAFHRFTVDRHLLECVARSTRSTRRVARPDLLLVGSLLHDIGKGFPGDHTDAGVEITEMLATRMGFPRYDVETLVAMVRLHLLLPAVATSRDLDEPTTIKGVAETVGSVQLLELLHTLTEADSIATGETAWTPWKAELVDELVRRVRTHFGGPELEPDELDPPEEALFTRYEGTLAVEAGEQHVAVVAPDRPALFASVVGVLALHGLGVRQARARSTDDGVAVSAFDVEPTTGAPDAVRIRTDILRALAGELSLDARLVERAERLAILRRPSAALPAQPVVIFDNDGSAGATIIEVRAPDAVGLLYRIAHALATLALDIRHAKVSTLGHEVIDTFYVVGTEHEKIVIPERLAVVERSVLDAIASPSVSGGSGPGRSESSHHTDENA